MRTRISYDLSDRKGLPDGLKRQETILMGDVNARVGNEQIGSVNGKWAWME